MSRLIDADKLKEAIEEEKMTTIICVVYVWNQLKK